MWNSYVLPARLLSPQAISLAPKLRRSASGPPTRTSCKIENPLSRVLDLLKIPEARLLRSRGRSY
jgi:hypothetical protein